MLIPLGPRAEGSESQVIQVLEAMLHMARDGQRELALFLDRGDPRGQLGAFLLSTKGPLSLGLARLTHLHWPEPMNCPSLWLPCLGP